MIGDFKVMGDYCYLQTNEGGTLERLPRMRFWWVLWFAFKNNFLGKPIGKSEVDAALKVRLTLSDRLKRRTSS
jgi:hypothetical protein